VLIHWPAAELLRADADDDGAVGTGALKAALDEHPGAYCDRSDRGMLEFAHAGIFPQIGGKIRCFTGY
jgi:hypothetical protein